jgi:putative flippase GtrA
VKLVPQAVLDWYNTPHGRRLSRYTMVSVVAVPVGVGFLEVGLHLFHWSPGWSALFGSAVGATPSYYLNRAWVWGKAGKSHLWKEIVPFWAMALLSTLFASWTVSETGRHVDKHRLIGQILILGAYLGGFAILWLVKYLIYNKVLFVVQHHPHDDPDRPDVEPALPN